MNSPPELPVVAFIAVAVVLLLIGIAIYLCQNQGETRGTGNYGYAHYDTRNYGYAHYDTRNYGYGQYENRIVLESAESADSVRKVKLDLHGCRSSEARDQIYKFLREYRHFNKVEIVTGRGQSSYNGRSVLKPLLEEILNEKGLRYYTRNEGGSYIISNC